MPKEGMEGDGRTIETTDRIGETRSALDPDGTEGLTAIMRASLADIASDRANNKERERERERR